MADFRQQRPSSAGNPPPSFPKREEIWWSRPLRTAGQRLALRFYLLLAAIFLPAFFTAYVAMLRTLESIHATEIDETFHGASVRLSDRLLPEPGDSGPFQELNDLPPPDRERLARELRRLFGEPGPFESMSIFAPDREANLRLLAAHGPPAAGGPFQQDRDALAQGRTQTLDFVAGDVSLRVACVPLLQDGQPRGVLHLVLQPRKVGVGALLPAFRRGFLLGGAGILVLLGVGTGFFFHFAVGRPITRLIDAMKRATEGDLNALVDIHSAEFGVLAGAYNQMMRRLKSSMDENRSLIEQIRKFNEELKSKVEAATRELAGKNTQLESANERLFLLQRQLTTLEKLATLGQIAALIAHELGTPLNAISGHLQLLLQDPVSDPRMLERLKVIDGQVDRLTGIVRNVLKSMRVPPPRFDRTDVKRVIGDVVEVFAPLAEKRRISFLLRLNEDLPQIGADAEQLQQVFMNLFTNAVDAMKGGGTLTVSASFVPEETAAREGLLPLAEGAAVRIDVSDTGGGMDEETARHAFEPFYTTRRAEGEPGASVGLGLGLSICKQILKNHRGEIAVSTRPGQGTTFAIYLPVEPGRVPV